MNGESSDGRELSERKRSILRAVVDAYITGGEPVGSKYLSGEGGITCSSATIRNEMAELEELGYLEQPHTSAGRIPSELGYRFYVDTLMESYRMTSKELEEINKLAHLKLSEMDQILSRVGRMMSMLTDYPVITAMPAKKATVVRQFKLMRLDAVTLLLVMITDYAGSADAKTDRIPSFGVDDAALIAVEQALNLDLAGFSADQITLPLMMSFRARLSELGCGQLGEALLTAIYNCLTNSEDNGEIRFEGVNRLLQYPEYSDPARISGLLGLLDAKTDLIDMVRNSDEEGVSVYIGNESSLDSLKGSAVVLKKLRAGGRVVGAVGVIGPCRMKYSKVVTMLDQFAKNIEAAGGEENIHDIFEGFGEGTEDVPDVDPPHGGFQPPTSERKSDKKAPQAGPPGGVSGGNTDE